MIRPGDRVAFRLTKDGIRTFFSLGPTEPVFAQGVFEVWRTRADYAWDARRGCRIVVPSMYRIIKRLGKGFYFAAGLQIPVEYAFIMRALPAGEDWRAVLNELSEQVMLLAYREREAKADG